ncbi:MAG: ATP-binding cassette domain-containing protein [Hydrogenibacillus schlegelii]|nr:ATP-binding cassette domain-containing protein [Hydrogenibacillus schlegelii]
MLAGLLRRAHHFPDELSGGEQQRVAIARAVVHRPPIVFADEPTAELDAARAAEVVRSFRALTRRHGMTVVMTTHDLDLLPAADFVFEMEDGRARPRSTGASTSPEAVLEPERPAETSDPDRKRRSPAERGDSES